MEIPKAIKTKLFKTGNSWVIAIPPALIKLGILDPEKEIEIKVSQDSSNGTKGVRDSLDRVEVSLIADWDSQFVCEDSSSF